MKAEQCEPRRRVLKRYSAKDRERLLHEQAQSGLTKKAFCEERGINVGTFHGWAKWKRSLACKPTFAEVEVSSCMHVAVEVLLPNGARIEIEHEGNQKDLIALIRGVCGC